MLWLAGAAAVAAGIIVPLALGGRGALAATASIPRIDAVALGALVIASAVARAIKLRVLAMRLGHRVGVGRALITAFASDAAFQATPAGAGGYPATVLLLRRGGMPAAAGVALSAADQALDSLFFALALPLACVFDLGNAVPAAWHAFAWLPAGIVLVAMATAAGAWRLRARWWPPLRGQLLRLRWLRERREPLRAFCMGVLADLSRLRNGSPLVTLALVLAVAAQWVARYGVLWFALAALGHALPFGLVFVAQSVALHAAQWTGVPAGIGGGDVALAAALSPWAPLAVLAPALLLWRLATFHTVLLLGAIALACDRRHVAVPTVAASEA
ncbi:hypothetical protein GCM10009105_24590 [Dokdonella soli]|uniref:Flippase-like domain-containing protein n=1 Tax=Dokdonella soli TaxID=529810 RepID=A0ABN1IMK8_9GAMM